MHERARVGLLDDGGAVEDVAAQELPAIVHRGGLEAARLREPDRALTLLRARGRRAARGQGRPPRLRRHAHRGEADVHQLHGILGRGVAIRALVHGVELLGQPPDVVGGEWAGRHRDGQLERLPVVAKIASRAAGVSASSRSRRVATNSWRMSVASMPSAEVMPGLGGTSTVGMPSSRASALACRGPAPPKATSTKSRGSYPRWTETTRMAAIMWAL